MTKLRVIFILNYILLEVRENNKRLNSKKLPHDDNESSYRELLEKDKEIEFSALEINAERTMMFNQILEIENIEGFTIEAPFNEFRKIGISILI